MITKGNSNHTCYCNKCKRIDNRQVHQFMIASTTWLPRRINLIINELSANNHDHIELCMCESKKK